jgi:hypothetical protein
MATETNEKKAKRAAKRYPYPRAATCQFNANLIDVQVLNISTSGIQFASKMKIETTEPIKVTWRDAKYGMFDPNFIIAREIHKPENKDFQYYYGAQYYDLVDHAKQNLLSLLKSFREEEKQETKQQVEKITPRYLFDVIEQDDAFLKRAFEAKDVPAYFDNVLKDIKEYEKEAFKFNDEVSVCVQKLTTHNFHCNLLGMMTAFMIEKSEIQSLYFQSIQTVLQKISETEVLVDQAIKKMIDDKTVQEESRRQIQRQFNESSNRLFYTKQGLLQSVVETFATLDSEALEFKDTFGKIKEEYERILEFTNSSFREDTKTATYKRRSKKPAEFSKAEAIMDIPVMSYKKPKYFLWFNVFFIFMAAVIFISMKISNIKNKTSMKEVIGIQIDIKEYRRFGTQLDLIFDTVEWKKLPENHKEDVYKKVIKYIKEDKQARSSIMFTTDGEIIKVVYEDMPTDEPPPAQ